MNQEQNYQPKKEFFPFISRFSGIMALIRTVCCIICTVVVIGFVTNVSPKINATLDNANQLLTDADLVVGTLTEDMPRMIDEISTTLDTANSGMTDALEKIDNIDIESLNNAIRDLHSVVDPLANLFRR